MSMSYVKKFESPNSSIQLSWIAVPEGLASNDFGGTGYQGLYGDTSLVYRLSDEELLRWKDTGKLYNPWAEGAMLMMGAMTNPYVVKTKSGKIQYGLRGVNPNDVAGVWMVDNGSKDFVERSVLEPLPLTLQSPAEPEQLNVLSQQLPLPPSVSALVRAKTYPKQSGPIRKTLTQGLMTGLVGITPEGKTRYTFPGLTEDDIMAFLIQNYKPQKEKVIYLPPALNDSRVLENASLDMLPQNTPNPPVVNSAQQNNSLKTVESVLPSPLQYVTQSKQFSPAKQITAGKDAGIFYKYEVGDDVHVWEIPPDLAELIRKNVRQSTNEENPSTWLHNIFYSDRRLPLQLYQDSIFHYFEDESDPVWNEYYDRFPERGIYSLSGKRYTKYNERKDAETSMAQDAQKLGYDDISIGFSMAPEHYLTPKKDYVYGGGSYIPIEDNKVIVRSLDNNSVNAIYGTKYDNLKNKDFTSCILGYGVDMKNSSIDQVDWKEAVDKYFPTPSGAQWAINGIKEIGTDFIGDMKSGAQKAGKFVKGLFGKKKEGGEMNYIDYYKSGSKIHIKKANRGKFTDYCGGKVTSECIARGKHSSSATVRKRATFAANARTWKHQSGGRVFFNTVENKHKNKTTEQILKEQEKQQSTQSTSQSTEQSSSNWARDLIALLRNETPTKTQETQTVDSGVQQAAGNSITVNLDASTRMKTAINYLVAKGLTRAGAAGVVGVFFAESGLQPGIVNKEAEKRDPARADKGIAQWQGDRRLAYDAYMASRQGTLEDELDYFLEEITQRPKVLEVLKTTSDVNEAVKAMHLGYENGTPEAFATPEQLTEMYTKAFERYNYGKYNYQDSHNKRYKYALTAYNLA